MSTVKADQYSSCTVPGEKGWRSTLQLQLELGNVPARFRGPGLPNEGRTVSVLAQEVEGQVPGLGLESSLAA